MEEKLIPKGGERGEKGRNVPSILETQRYLKRPLKIWSSHAQGNEGNGSGSCVSILHQLFQARQIVFEVLKGTLLQSNGAALIFLPF